MDSTICEDRFQDQVAVVTGSARGIGKAIAYRLAVEGAKVVLIDKLKKELDESVEEFNQQSLNTSGLVIDITEENQVKETLDKIAESYGRIDLMVNCAGIVGPTATNILEYTLEEFRQIIEINLIGSFLMTKYSLPKMLDRNYGRILLLTSIGGKEGNPGMVGYAASKSGVIGLVKGVGKEFAETGVTINGLAPAVIATPMNLDTDPKTMKYMTDKIPMKRLGTVEEVSSIACWIVSLEASFNTGFIFDLSGGRATF